MKSGLSGEELARAVEEGRIVGKSAMQVARELGMSYTILHSRLLAHKRGFTIDENLFRIEMGDPWVLDRDWTIIGDVHVPTTEYEFALLASVVARKMFKKGPRKLLIAGDFFNMDTFSTYISISTQPTWAQEREAAKALLKAWMDTFDEIRMIMGNHDRRVQRFTAGAFDTDDILSLIISNPDRVRLSNYGYCTIHSGGQKWHITHPKNYSLSQLSVAEQLAYKHDANVMSFHEHHLAIGWDRYKRHVIVNGGCCVRAKNLSYAALDDSKSPGMALGFAVLKNGTPYLFGEEPFTDWGAWI